MDKEKGVSCPALLISAPASGQGKTTVVAAMARYHRQQGRVVRVFKTGPDFIDPMIHQRASGEVVHQIDLWMVGEQRSKQLLYEAAQEADLILIEGVMGLFDGKPSSADLAISFGVPVAAVIDASSMAQTFGALAQGLASYRHDLDFVGVIANRVASEGHGNMLQQSVPDGVKWMAGINRSEEISLPERHLGLFQATDIDDLEKRLDAAASLIEGTGLSELPDPVNFHLGDILAVPPKLLTGQRIAIARDKAFSFVYQANLNLLEALGAQLVFFSPLDDAVLPEADSLYLPGGYPELYLPQLAVNIELKAAIREHYRAGKPIVAECGGMLYLLDSLADKESNVCPMVGVISASAKMQTRLGGLGLQWVEFQEGKLRGHTFHYSIFDREPLFDYRAEKHPYKTAGEGIIRSKGLLASSIHWYFPSNPALAAQLFLKRNEFLCA